MDKAIRTALIEYIKGFATESRVKRLEDVIRNRTNRLTVVLEDIRQPHNASAIIRSCDCFGVQHVHVIEKTIDFDPSNQVTMGADQWLDLNFYRQDENEGVRACFSNLREQGFKILAASPHDNDVSIHEVDITQKTALVFGSELIGLSEEVVKQADGCVNIPMHGFTESFNVSVSAAICVFDLTTRLRESNIDWMLTKDEQEELLLRWLKVTVKAGDELERKFLNELGNF